MLKIGKRKHLYKSTVVLKLASRNIVPANNYVKGSVTLSNN